MEDAKKESWSKSSEPNMKSHPWKWGGLSVLLGLGVFGFSGNAYRIWQFSATLPPPQPADYAIVLGAASYGPLPSPVFARRIEQGVALYRQGLVKKLIFTGGPGHPTQAQVAKEYASQYQIPEEDLWLEERSQNTWENLKFSVGLTPEGREARYLLVSDGWHLKRAQEMAKDLGISCQSVAVDPSSYRSWETSLPFLLRETAALFYYRIKKLVTGSY